MIGHYYPGEGVDELLIMQATHFCNQQPCKTPVLKGGVPLIGDCSQQIDAIRFGNAARAQGMAMMGKTAGIHSIYLS